MSELPPLDCDPVPRKPKLPHGVRAIPLTTHADARGNFTEILRTSWCPDLKLVQWNFVNSEPGTLRGVHVHLRHWDYLVVTGGRMLLALVDLRKGSPTERLSCLLELSSTALEAAVIPPGVAHGFYFPVASQHVYAVSEFWSDSDELGCRFDDPALGLQWPNPAPRLSDRDNAAGSLAELLPKVPDYRALAALA